MTSDNGADRDGTLRRDEYTNWLERRQQHQVVLATHRRPALQRRIVVFAERVGTAAFQPAAWTPVYEALDVE